MTDNQTIIDGVDVSKCEYFLNEDGYIPETGKFIDGACEAIAVHDGYGEFMYYGVCKSVNCYFKRAEKEIDENRKLIEKLEEEIACLKSKKTDLDKQIIIDSIDVRGCEYLFTNHNDERCCSASLGSDSPCNPEGMICYKYIEHLKLQLKRKEQECEKIKQDNATLFDKAIEARKENSALEEQLFQIKTENETYKQALDEIEEYLKTQLDGFGNAVCSVDKSAIKEISDIINKAKDGE